MCVRVVRRVQADTDPRPPHDRGRTTVLIGDGASDRHAALVADAVFAKDSLAAWCDSEGVAYMPFDGLDDVRRVLCA